MVITKHGHKRIKQRLGLPKRAQTRHIKTVLQRGIVASREGFEKFEVMYHGFLYIFALTATLEPVLVTTYHTT